MISKWYIKYYSNIEYLGKMSILLTSPNLHSLYDCETSGYDKFCGFKMILRRFLIKFEKHVSYTVQNFKTLISNWCLKGVTKTLRKS